MNPIDYLNPAERVGSLKMKEIADTYFDSCLEKISREEFEYYDELMGIIQDTPLLPKTERLVLDITEGTCDIKKIEEDKRFGVLMLAKVAQMLYQKATESANLQDPKELSGAYKFLDYAISIMIEELLNDSISIPGKVICMQVNSPSSNFN